MPKLRIANGLNVHYSIVGNGPDLILIHGLVADLANWHFKIVPMLWDHFRVITYDLRGHGYTEMTETGYTPTQLATDLKELMDELGIEKAYLAGHSLGADIALYFAYMYPERVERAILLEPIVPALVGRIQGLDTGYNDFASRLLTKLGVEIDQEKRLDPDYLAKEALEMPVKWGPLKDMQKPERFKEWLVQLAFTTSITKDLLDVGDLTAEEIPNIRAPIHLILDSDSRIWRESYIFLRDNLPNVTAVEIETGLDAVSHLITLEAPEVVAEEIMKALGVVPAR